MKFSDFTPQFPVLWASSGTTATVQYPLLSGTSLATGRASIASGFPAVNFTPPAAGGVYPWGADWNGALKTLSVSAQNYEAGMVPTFSQNFANAVGGYPQSAIVADANTADLFWVSTADANESTPGASGASWFEFRPGTTVPVTLVQTAATGNFTVPSGIHRITFYLRAAGGGGGAGGGNTSSAASAGGGGAAGGWLKLILNVVPGNNVSWVVGAGGSAGVNNGSSGGVGGDTVLYVSGTEVARVYGGGGGINATQGSVGKGGAGGLYLISNPSMVAGWWHEDGAGGSYGVYAGSDQAWGGAGGPSYGKTSVQVTGPNQTGLAGNTGGGGSGGTGTQNGGPGAAGEVIYEY